MVTLAGDAESVASLIFAIGDGLGLQMVSDPEWAREAVAGRGDRHGALSARRRVTHVTHGPA